MSIANTYKSLFIVAYMQQIYIHHRMSIKNPFETSCTKRIHEKCAYEPRYIIISSYPYVDFAIVILIKIGVPYGVNQQKRKKN